MLTGQRVIDRTPGEVVEKLRGFLASANCEVRQRGPRHIRFRHGTYLTQSASLFPKEGEVRLSESNGGTHVHYEIHSTPFMKGYFGLLAVLFIWTIFVPILVHRILAVHPRRFMENLLDGV